MSSNWERIGQQIRDTVMDAVENQDYEKLNQMISNTINQAVDAVTDGVRNAANSSKNNQRRYKSYNTDYRQVREDEPHTKRASSMKYHYGQTNTGYSTGQSVKQPPAVIQAKAPSKIVTVAGTAIGYAIGGVQLLGFLGNLAATSIANAAFGVGPGLFSDFISVISATFMILGFGIGIAGTRKIGRIDRFKSYLLAIGQKEYCNISKMVDKVGKSKKTVIKDIEYMIQRGWFLEGHLDKEKSCLMLTDQMYDQYCQLERQRALEQQEAREREIKSQQETKERENREQQNTKGKATGEYDAEEQQLKAQQTDSRAALSPEVQKIIEQGDEYVRKIRACNDAIPGEEISEKIYHIELLVDKIFDRVEENPKCVSDIRKLMDYYLPTTVKLLEAYAQMDAQPVSGENIQNAKKEIEATLDTLNVAFEKLLDGLFMETAWDVSSDISVLNTMLAQEGLKDDGLKTK